jgi:hypothetical protein
MLVFLLPKGLLLTQRMELEHKNRVLSEVPDRKDGLKGETLIEKVTQNAAAEGVLGELKEVYSCCFRVADLFNYHARLENSMKYNQSIRGNLCAL